MKESEKQLILRAIETWRCAGERLEAERKERLRRMTDEDVRQAVVDLLAIPSPAGESERDNGLVEQQRLFRLFRERGGR